MKKYILFLLLVLLFSCSQKERSYHNEDMKLKFIIPEQKKGYKVFIKDHTDFLEQEKLLKQFVLNYRMNRYFEIVPFLPTRFVELRIINKRKVIITKSAGVDGTDNQVGREITFYHNDRYVSIYIVKYLEKLKANASSEKSREYFMEKVNVYSEDELMVSMLNEVLDSLEFY